MKFNELNVKLPAAFRRVYETGAMEWLECTHDEFMSRRDEFFSRPETFGFINADFEPLLFEEYDKYAAELREYISLDEKYGNKIFNSDITLIPFAHTGRGDMHCFMYENEDTEPKVVLYEHDTGDVTQYGIDFDDFLYSLMLEAGAWEEDVNGDVWKAHLSFLTPEYRKKLDDRLAGKECTVEDFEKLLGELDCPEVNIWR